MSIGYILAESPGSPQGGEAVCKTVAFGMVGSIPTPGTNQIKKHDRIDYDEYHDRRKD